MRTRPARWQKPFLRHRPASGPTRPLPDSPANRPALPGLADPPAAGHKRADTMQALQPLPPRHRLRSPARIPAKPFAPPAIVAAACLAALWAGPVPARAAEGGLACRPTAAGRDWVFSENGRAVLTYHHGVVAPPEGFLEQVSANNRRYARARADYIHPLHGLDGEVLTHDWPVDHPHHRGIYWAWPETMWGERMGDLHALQEVFARPTGEPEVTERGEAIELRARHRWLWQERTPVVAETAVIRVYPVRPDGRRIDLEFRLRALTRGVTIARRETRLYGGLNLRLAAVAGQQIAFTNAPAGSEPRFSWGDLSGRFPGGRRITGLAILQHPANPEFPGDWVQYPELNWLQPTFPTAGTRCLLPTDRPLVLRYRLWIHPGRPDPAALVAEWQRYARQTKPDPAQ
ncbi:MAG: hypothetical protein D6766_01760 [Verrucomicrobia bacterium]|nr:MAG: hypothetical protein D6766_01760 [Verrucomicrobiota bacterium]